VNTHRFFRQVALKGFLVLLLVMLAFQSFGMNGLAAPATSSPDFQEGEISQGLTCSPSSPFMTPTYCDIQIVLMIDDSGSMRSNDPDGLRNQGAKNLVDILVMQYYLPAVQLKADNPDLDFRLPDVQVAVIHFSNDVKENPQWIKIDPSSIEDWKSQQVELFEAIDWKNPANPRTQTTNFIDPFEKAAELLTPNNVQAGEESCVRRSILLFTDGTPEDLQGRLNGDKLLEHMGTIEEVIQGVQDQLPEQQKLRIYVTGFKVDPNYWDAVEPDWSRIVAFPAISQGEIPRALLLEKDSFIQLPIRMEEITAFLSDVKPATLNRDPQDSQSYSIEIPNHIQSLRLTLYNLDPESGLLITDTNGNEIIADGEKVILSGADTSVEVWQFITPLAGSYTVRVSKRGGIITGLLTYQNLAVEFDSEPGEFQVGKPSAITFKLVDSSGNVVLPEEDSLTLKVSVTQDAQQIPLEWTRDNYQFSWTPESAGKSQFNFVASLAPVDAKEDKLLDCSGNVEVDVKEPDVPQLDEKLTMVITPPTACVPPKETITLPMQLNYQGKDGAWASSLEWADVSAKAKPGDQNVNVTRNTIDEAGGQYELKIGPIANVKQIQQILVSATAGIKGRTTAISDNETITITFCSVPVPQCDCDEGWILWFWPLIILLVGLIIILLVFKFRSERTEKNYQEAKQDISRTGFWHLLFWPLLILLVLLVLDRLLQNFIIPLWLFLALILIWIFSLLLVRFTPDGKYTRRRPWWLIILLLLLVLIWYIFFSNFWIYLLWFLAILLVFMLVIIIWPVPSCTRDDLTVIEGIGPGVEKLLNDNGIYTFQQLADADIDELNVWLNNKGWDYMDPKTWPNQAELADKAKKSGKKEDQDKFDEYAAWVKDGIAPDEYNKPEKDRKPPEESDQP